MGLFPTNANDGDEVTNAGGTTFKYVAADDKWIIKSAGVISDTAYNATSWDANTDVATKNAIRDKFESLPDPNHNDLPGLNAGDSYEHITQTQKNTLANIGDAYKIETKEIDTTGIADTKILKYNGTKWVITDDSTGGAGGDTDALHDNVANEITAITEKTVTANNDEIVIEDSAAGFVKKSVKLSNILSMTHYREAQFGSMIAYNNFAAGVNNVYKSASTGWIYFGYNSKTSGHFYSVTIYMEEDYVNNGKFEIAWLWKATGGSGDQTISYRILIQKVYSLGIGEYTIVDTTSTTTCASDNRWRAKKFTVTPSSLSAGHAITLRLYLESTTHNVAVPIQGFNISYQVNGVK